MVELWNLFIFQPILNGLILLYNFTAYNFGLAIILFAVFIHLLLFPLTKKQLEITKKFSALQPKLQELQKKYGKNKEKLQRETLKLYREAGINPLGCLWTYAIQLPIWIALYYSIIRAMPQTPEDLLALSEHLYSIPLIYKSVPLNENFLWLNLSLPDGFYILPIMLMAVSWFQLKITTVPSPDLRQQSTNRMMSLMFPLFFGVLALSFPSGLVLYWIVSSLIFIIFRYLVIEKRVPSFKGLKILKKG